MVAYGPVRLLVFMIGVATAFYIGPDVSHPANVRPEQPRNPGHKIHRAPARWWYPDLKSCVLYLGPDGITPEDGLYCDAAWDGVLCWPVTVANNVVYQSCPPLRGLDTKRYAFRQCGPDGTWLGRQDRPFSSPAGGWTNYTGCFAPEAYALYQTFFES